MAVNAQQDEQKLLTLFTTQQERRLIDNNRYRQQAPEVSEAVPDKETPEQVSSTTYYQYNASFELIGVALSEDGNHFAWVNGIGVKNGDELDDGSRVFISPKLNNMVQIKTPDGVFHKLEAGKKINVIYMKPESG